MKRTSGVPERAEEPARARLQGGSRLLQPDMHEASPGNAADRQAQARYRQGAEGRLQSGTGIPDSRSERVPLRTELPRLAGKLRLDNAAGQPGKGRRGSVFGQHSCTRAVSAADVRQSV